MTFALASQFHVYLLTMGSTPVQHSVLNVKVLVGFQPGEGPSGDLLRDCTTSPINRFAAFGATCLLLGGSVLAYPLLSWGRVWWLLGPDQDQGFLDILWLQTVAVPRQGSQQPTSCITCWGLQPFRCVLQPASQVSTSSRINYFWIDIYDENIFKLYLLYVFVTYLT